MSSCAVRPVRIALLLIVGFTRSLAADPPECPLEQQIVQASGSITGVGSALPS